MEYIKKVDIQYFGNVNLYKILANLSHVIFDQYEPNQKRSFNNRCLILGANGTILLSVPLEKGRLQKAPLKDIRICNAEKWQKRHWKSILSSYNGSPWFSYFSDNLSLIFATPYTFLLDWNLQCMDFVIKNLGLNVDYELSEKEEKGSIDPGEPDDLHEGSESMRPDFRYQQVFESPAGFVAGLCILDLLFCAGPKMAVSLLRNSNVM